MTIASGTILLYTKRLALALAGSVETEKISLYQSIEDRCPLLDKGLLAWTSTRLGLTPPPSAAPCESSDVIGPPRGRSANTALPSAFHSSTYGPQWLSTPRPTFHANDVSEPYMKLSIDAKNLVGLQSVTITMTEPNLSVSRPKFTRGEKCILTHLLLTIGVITVLLIIYLIHILVVDHDGSTTVFDTRRFVPTEDTGLHKYPVGLLYVNTTPTKSVCNTLLLAQEWSISPGHCAAMRSDPDLAYLLYTWRIKYPYKNAGTKIKRSIVHPNFNRDTFSDNVGLFQHNPVSGIQSYHISKINVGNYYAVIESKNMAIIGWDHSSKDGKGKIELHYVEPVLMENCTSYVASIIELRPYEFCIKLKKNVTTILGHGAVIINSKDLTVSGIFTWGERQQKFLPLIGLNLSHFKEWIHSIILFMP